MNKDFIKDENKEKLAVILCGGPGSRMGDLVSNKPKTLLEVHGKPILWYIFWSLYKYGFRKIILPIGYKGKMIESCMKEISINTDIEIITVDTGVGTPIAKRMEQILDIIQDDSDFFLLNSDTIFDFDIDKMYQKHRSLNSLVTLSSVEVASPWGIMSVKDGKLIGFDRGRGVHKLVSKNAREGFGLVNSGLAWINKSSLALIDLNSCADFETAVFQKAIEMQRATYFQIEGTWIPIDTPKDLNSINLMIDDESSHGGLAKDMLRKFDELENRGLDQAKYE